MTEDEKKLVFPIKFDKCPACGSTERIAEMVGNELKAEGRMSQDSRIVITASATPVVDATRVLAQVMAPMLTSLYDICVCGNIYCIEIQRSMALVDVQQVNLPGMPDKN